MFTGLELDQTQLAVVGVAARVHGVMQQDITLADLSSENTVNSHTFNDKYICLFMCMCQLVSAMITFLQQSDISCKYFRIHLKMKKT